MAKHLKTSADVIAAAVAARADGPGDELPDAPAASAD